MKPNPPLPFISPQAAHDRGLFGPVYHGTTSDNLAEIVRDGFKIFEGERGMTQISNGYPNEPYGLTGIPAPVHHLGYGIYFTTVRAIAQRFAHGSSKLIQFFLDVPRVEQINFASPRRMMEWWITHGYAPILAKVDRISATKVLTRTLAAKFDAVWFLGKGLHQLLDGDQICVYNPVGRVFAVDPRQAKGLEIGARVRRVAIAERHYFAPDGAEISFEQAIALRDAGRDFSMQWSIDPFNGVTGIIQNIRPIGPEHTKYAPPGATQYFVVRWTKGGTDHNVTDPEIMPA